MTDGGVIANGVAVVFSSFYCYFKFGSLTNKESEVADESSGNR